MTHIFRAGAATVEITPPVGTPMSGYPDVRLDLPWTPDAMKGYVGRRQPSESVHDPLLATALALEGAGERAVVLALDTLVVSRAFTAAVRRALAAEGVAGEHVLVAASHTHAGPDLFGWWEGAAADALAKATLERAVAAARKALDRLEPVELAYGEAELAHVSVNRRDEREGPIDPAVSVLAARSHADGGTVALLVSFACHPVTLDYANLAFSGDWVHPLREALGALHPGAGIAYLNGAAGNLNPARYPYEQRANIYVPQTLENRPVYWGGFEDARRVGHSVAGAALQAAERALPLERADVHGVLRPVALPLKRGETLEQFLDFMALRPEYRRALEGRDELETEVQLLDLGGVRLVALPGEPFVELGLELKLAGGRATVVVGCANDDVRYVMTDDAYVAGQYETVGTPLAAGSARALVAAAAGLLEGERTEELVGHRET